ncbi:type II secretion system inner membrane protein GspF [Parapedomonas caeni]
MSAFDYLALDASGRECRGDVAAATEEQARALLLQRQLLPLRVQRRMDGKAGGGEDAARPAWQWRRHLSTKELTLFTRQLATLIAVSPLEEALRSIASQADRPHVAATLWRVHAGVVEGRRLADAMAIEPRSFPALYRAMVAAGEGSGAMTEILERLADLQERQALVRGKVMTALAYPAMLTLTAGAIIIGLMTYVIPKVVEQFTQMGQTLPLLTRMVIGAADFLTDHGPALLLGILFGAIGFGRAMRNETVHARVDRWLLGLPLLGRLQRDLHAARLARTLSTMIDNGMPLLDGLAITGRTVRNRVLRAATLQIVDSVREGGSLSAAMRRGGLFPPLLVHMTASGETSGQLATMLARAADYLEREFDAYTSAALSLLEPAIIILMGGVIGTIVLSILLPILQLNTVALS